MDSRKAEIYCGNCGLVLDENLIDYGPEWRVFDPEQRDKRTRVGAPATYTISDKGLSTNIDWRNKDIYGNKISERTKAQMYRLRKWNKRIKVSGTGERNLAYALSELDRQCSRLNIPRSVREDAALIYRTASRKSLIRGRTIESIVASSIYISCRRFHIPRTLDEVANSSKIPKKYIGKHSRVISRELNIKLKPTSPIDYIPRFSSELGLSGEVEAKAIDILHKSIKKGLLNGKDPTGVAASALYIASKLIGEKITQKGVANVSGVTEVTIRNRYREMMEGLNVTVF